MADRAAALSHQLRNAAQPEKNQNREQSPKKSDTISPDAPFEQAVSQEVFRRLQLFAAGVSAYRQHSYRRDLEPPPVAWSEGTTRLLDFSPAGGQPVLFVPSLINRSYILDLSADSSLLRWMAAETDLRPLLVDWDAPGNKERSFTLTDYIASRLDGAFATARDLSPSGEPVAVVGYCMGGLLALALALRQQDNISRLTLLATPWNFHAERVEQAEAVGRAIAAAQPVLDASGELPVDVIQSMFSGLDPFLVLRKFITFAQLDPDTDKAHQFVALEDWLNDGVALAAPVARECLAGWYGENTPHNLRWRVDGDIVDPAGFSKPTLVLSPQQDRIVPPDSANALAQALPGANLHSVPFGHIGMVAGGRAKSAIWPLLAAWLSHGTFDA